nr:reverse transcriptase domain protein [Colletotrichum truncatum]KAF6783050.1 reverse transcriptase domain protein [Colletotrichum truncatum]
MSSQISVLTSTTRLTCRRDFPVWYDALYAEADAADVWDLIDPDDTTSPSDPREDDEELSIESWITQQNEKQRRTYDRKRKAYDSILQHRAEASDDTGEELQEPVAQPTLTQNTPGTFERYTNYLASKSGRDVKETVDKDILYAARSEILANNQRSLRALIQYLRKRYAPSESSSQTTVREEYLLLLEKANTSVNPQTWLRDFHRVLLRALRFRIPESQGTLASKTFLRAVGHRFAPSWATSELTEIVKMERKGDRIPTVSEYRDMLEDLLYEDTLYDKNRGKTSGVYATLAGRPSEAISDGKSGSKGKGKSEACPCNKPHNANPLECTRVEYALTGRIKPSQDKLSRDECKEIRKRINQSENYDLRAELARKGWIWATEPPSFRNPAPPRNRSSGNTGSKAKSQQEENESEVTLKRNIHAVTISRELLREISDDFDSDYDQPSVFATPLTGPHVLSRSTVLDNCGATHLVNNLDLLESSSIKTCIGDERVDSGTASYPILAKGTWILPKALNGPDGDLTADLTLHNVGYVENFHVNIVSEALLRKTGIWYSGLDNTLRQGTYKNSVVVKHLVRKMNITFFEYKTGSQYIAQKRITSSNAGIVNHLVLAVQDPARLSLRKPPDRYDDAWLWHLRSGHLAPDALERMVSNVRGVKIKGPTRLECEYCATAHAKQLISRRTSERKAIRPYYRVSWDLFDYPTSFDKNRWLLVIKDEYTGRLFAFPRVSKSHTFVFDALRHFERWVARQRGVTLCKLRQDVERAVIAINGMTEYQLWAQHNGIEIEETPPYTKEPNGGGERAGQELITRAIKMLSAAGLPTTLWVEAVMAAAYLYNMSPRKRRAWLSPIQVEESWFRQYFRWWQPQYSASLARDLRPHWGWTYAYGCRAYPLKKDREADRNRRNFKVEPRGHIGYLVGYVMDAHNLYRVWIPSLDQVIITRNVTFDETKFYSKDDAKASLQAEVAETVSTEISEPPATANPGLQFLGLAKPSELVFSLEEQPLPPAFAPSTVISEETTVKRSAVNSRREEGLLTPEPTPEPAAAPEGTDGQTTGQQSSEAMDAGVPDPGHEALSEAVEDVIYVKTNNEPPREPAVEADSSNDLGGDSPTHPVRPHSDNGNGREPEIKTKRVYNRKDYGQQQGKPRRSPRFAQHFAFLQTERNWETFFHTYMPDQQKAVEEANQAHYTLHCFVFASIHQAKHSRAVTPQRVKIHTDELIKPPRTWKSVEKMPTHLRNLFYEAAQAEISKLEEMDAWKIIDEHEASTKPIPLKWVFTYKLDQDGYLDRCKARICVRGDLQAKHPLEQTYAATLAARTFRVAMALAAEFDLEVDQFDVVNAFLNATRGPNDPPVVCYLPDGFKQNGKYVELRRALYGLRDAPLLWYKEFSSTLRRLGLKPASEDPCLFTSNDKKVMVLFYVDDILVLYHRDHREAAQNVINGVKAEYELKDQGPVEWYLGIRVIRDREKRTINLAHDQYIERVAKKFNLIDSIVPHTPLPFVPLQKNTAEATPDQVKQYQEKVGSILYTAIMIRPDVAFACATLSRFLTNPSLEHQKAANQVIRYLYHTRYLSLCFGSSGGAGAQVLLIAGDASFADDEETRRSSQGYIISLFGGPIQWKAARQNTVTTSTTEAELLSLENTAKETIALKRLFRDIELDLGDVWKIHCDNRQTIRLVVGDKERISTRLRHVDIQNMWLRQEYAKKTFDVVYMPTDEMPADGLTKALSRAKFEHFRALLNLQDIRAQVTRSEEKQVRASNAGPEAES